MNLKNITLPLEALHCNDSYCRNNSHKRDILKFYKDTVSALLISGDIIHSQGNNDYNIIPGWNELVSEQHREARETYLEWRNHGKPRFGPIYWQMTRSKLLFKRALKTCRKLNDQIIDDKIARQIGGDSKKNCGLRVTRKGKTKQKFMILLKMQSVVRLYANYGKIIFRICLMTPHTLPLPPCHDMLHLQLLKLW